MARLFGTDGIRDRFGKGVLEPPRTVRLARAIGYLLKKTPGNFHTLLPASFPGPREVGKEKHAKGRVLIGRDTRASGSEIESSLLDGFMSMGISTALAGVVPTPGLAWLARAWGAAVGIMISASHNPAEDNGIKLLSPQGLKIPDSVEETVEEFYFDEILGTKLQKSDTIKIAPPKELAEQTAEYVDFLAGEGRPLAGLRLVVDAAEGAASAFAPTLFERLGAKVTAIHAKPDGKNINAGCGALHPEEMARTVVREKAHAGVAFDGDADRAIFADEKGELRDGDHVLAICAEAMKAKIVVSTVMANFGLEQVLKERGTELVRTKVGDRYVVESMLARGAVLGGEPSGHVVFFDTATAGDGMLTALRVFRLLTGRSLSSLCAGLKKCPQILVNINVKSKPPIEEVARGAIEKAQAELAGRGRVLVRYSGTENLCRVMVEGEDAAAVKRLTGSIADAVQSEIG